MATTPPADERLLAAIDRLARARRAFTQEVATAAGLSPLQADLLALLAADPPPEHRAADLARELDVRAATIADALRALHRKGLVTERVDPADGRRKILGLTARGRRLAAQVARARQSITNALAELPEEVARAGLLAVLEMIAVLHRHGIVTVDRSCLTCRFRRLDGSAVGYCTLLDAPLTPATVRVDCPEHAPRAA